MRNGANGISLFIPARDEAISKSPTIAPIQNDNKNTLTLPIIPTIAPMPSANFTSPKPMALPFEKNHKKKNGAASTNPDKTAGRKRKPATVKDFQITESPAIAINGYTILSGIILCFRSYIIIIISSEASVALPIKETTLTGVMPCVSTIFVYKRTKISPVINSTIGC